MYPFTDQFLSNKSNVEFLNTAMMGPNAMRVAEEMASALPFTQGMRVLDLGCGCGLSTLLLTKKYGATVIAADLWIEPTDNYERFSALEIADRAIPISVDATCGLPFASGYFDVLFSVDAYHYFGRTPQMLPSLIPHVKKGGYIAVAIPGWKEELAGGVPEELTPFLTQEDAQTLQTARWWKDLWSRADGIELISVGKMACEKQAWEEWLQSSNPYAVQDLKMMKAENGNHFTFIQLIAKVL